MRLTVEELIGIQTQSYRAGTLGGDRQQRESIQALVSENSRLKDEVRLFESRAKTQVIAAEQHTSFPAMNAERQRIARGIVQYFETMTKQKKKPTAEMLLFGLALGDLV